MNAESNSPIDTRQSSRRNVTRLENSSVELSIDTRVRLRKYTYFNFHPRIYTSLTDHRKLINVNPHKKIREAQIQGGTIMLVKVREATDRGNFHAQMLNVEQQSHSKTSLPLKGSS